MADSIDRGVGGYDNEFASPLPQEYECPICHLAFREPVQIEECGHRFCQSCLMELRKRLKGPFSCPLDRGLLDGDKIFLDKAAKRAVLSLTVKCNNFKKKCEWTGELGNLEDHIKSCLYEEITCPNEQCNESFLRRNLNSHLLAKCKMRVVSCQHCSEKYIHKDVRNHVKVCKRLPLECNNKCGLKGIPREELKNYYADMEPNRDITPYMIEPVIHHNSDGPITGVTLTFDSSQDEGDFNMDKNWEHGLMPLHLMECPMSILPCTYKDIGCGFKGKKDNLDEHLRTMVNMHLTLAMQKIRENEARSYCSNGCFIWKVANFKQLFEAARNSEDEVALLSQPFYTSQYGYKLRLKIYLDGRDRGKGTHLSLYLIIMKGEYDGLLDWPFDQKITFYLLDQSEERKHKVHQLSPNRSLPNVKAVFNRPTMKENLGIGNPSFVSHEIIDQNEYIRDDSFFIKCEVTPNTR